MATSFRRKKHQDERASEASDFLCTHFQMCTKQMETVSTLWNHFMFLQMVEKKDTNSLSETEANWTQKSIFSSNQFPVKKDFEHLSHSIAFAWPNHYYDSWKNVFCLGIPTAIKFEKNSVIGNLLRWTPFLICQTYSSPFFDYISIKKYLHPVVWGFAALWVQKNYKDRRILMT